MSDVIEFLERIGRDARVHDRAWLSRALDTAPIDPKVRASLLSHDRSALERALGTRVNLCCAVHVPWDDGEIGERGGAMH